MALETERLILRPWEETDAEACYECAKDPRVGPAAGWPAHRNIDETKQILRTVLSAPETFAVVLKETGKPVGCISLHFRDGRDTCELGYWLGASYWGKGYMTEAAREILRHAFADLGVSSVQCGYFEGNARSACVQEKLGFSFSRTDTVFLRQTGETRTVHENLLTREAWAAGLSREQA